jgi:hypothetical protein
MNRKQLILGASTFVGLTALALAHHVPVGLSHVAGAEILREVQFFTAAGVFGVPATKVGVAEVPGHHDPVGIADGDTFVVVDQSGTSESVTLEAGDFADISGAVMDEVVAVINAKAALFEAVEQNGFLVLRGNVGGPAASIEVADGAGGPLAKMGMGGGLAFGSEDLELTLSIPDPSLDLAGGRYLVLASTTAGSFTLGSHTVPSAPDALTLALIAAARGGQAAGFKGVLDANGDASAMLLGSQLAPGFAGGYPDELHLAYLVLAPGTSQVAYVSNRFTVDFR